MLMLYLSTLLPFYAKTRSLLRYPHPMMNLNKNTRGFGDGLLAGLGGVGGGLGLVGERGGVGGGFAQVGKNSFLQSSVLP